MAVLVIWQILKGSHNFLYNFGTALYHEFIDRNIFEDSYELVKHFPDFPLCEYTIASFKQKLLVKRSNSVLPEQEIQEMFY